MAIFPKMASSRQKLHVTVLAVVLLYLVFSFFRSASVPDHSTKSELYSNKLRLERELELHSNWKENGLNFHTNKVSRLPRLSTLRLQLSYQFPYEPKKGFQKNIWQTWKVGPDDEKFPQKYKRFHHTWSNNNPSYKHNIITDEQCDAMVNDFFGAVPDVAKAWNAMPKSILKADFFRYLILFARGGVYSDIDTTDLKPVDTWISNNETIMGKPNHAGLVVGIEADPDRPDWAEWYARRIQFCQWTIQAKKGHPMLRELIAKITEVTLDRLKKGQLNKILGKDAGGDIMNWTGPGIWTDSVFEYMNNVMQPDLNYKTKQYDDVVTWKLFTGLQAPMVLEDVLVLPITSFSPDVGQMGAHLSAHPMAYAKHMFLGSWKDDKKD